MWTTVGTNLSSSHQCQLRYHRNRREILVSMAWFIILCLFADFTHSNNQPVDMDSNNFNPYHAEFLKWNNPPSIFGTFHYHF